VSQSEAGFEKIMQAVTLELVWPVNAISKSLEILLEVK
jgi:4-alpha-glucanotransferase